MTRCSDGEGSSRSLPAPECSEDKGELGQLGARGERRAMLWQVDRGVSRRGVIGAGLVLGVGLLCALVLHGWASANDVLSCTGSGIGGALCGVGIVAVYIGCSTFVGVAGVVAAVILWRSRKRK